MWGNAAHAIVAIIEGEVPQRVAVQLIQDHHPPGTKGVGVIEVHPIHHINVADAIGPGTVGLHECRHIGHRAIAIVRTSQRLHRRDRCRKSPGAIQCGRGVAPWCAQRGRPVEIGMGYLRTGGQGQHGGAACLRSGNGCVGFGLPR